MHSIFLMSHKIPRRASRRCSSVYDDISAQDSKTFIQQLVSRCTVIFSTLYLAGRAIFNQAEAQLSWTLAWINQREDGSRTHQVQRLNCKAVLLCETNMTDRGRRGYRSRRSFVDERKREGVSH